MNKLKSKDAAVSTTKVLLTDTNRWALSARLAIGLSEAGCQVSAICPKPGHPLLKTRAFGMTPNGRFRTTLQDDEPNVLTQKKTDAASTEGITSDMGCGLKTLIFMLG